MSAQQHKMNLDASRTKRTQQNDAYTRPRVKPRRQTKVGGFTKEDIDQELQRIVKQARKNASQPQQEEQMQEEMEVVRNTMPATLQRLKDFYPDVMESQDQVIGEIVQAAQTRYGVDLEKSLASELPNFDVNLTEKLQQVFSSPDEIQRTHEKEYTNNLLELITDVNAQWEQMGESRRVTLNSEHLTALTHYFRMVRLGHMKAGLAQLTRAPQHIAQFNVYRQQLEEFNQQLTHNIFFDGLVAYDEVVASADDARYQEIGREEGTQLFAAAIEMAADALVRLALDENADITLSFFKDVDEGTAGGDGFLGNLKRMVGNLSASDIPVFGKLSTFLSGFITSTRAYVGAEYVKMQQTGLVSDRFVTNSNKVVGATGDQLLSLAEDADADNGRGLLTVLFDEMKNNARWAGRRAGDLRSFLEKNLLRASSVTLAALAAGVLVFATGHFITGDASARAGAAEIVASLTTVSTTLKDDIIPNLGKTSEVAQDLSKTVGSLLTEEQVKQQISIVNMTFTPDVLASNEIGLNLQLSDYETVLLKELNTLQDPDIINIVKKFIGQLGAYPGLTTYEDRVAILEKIKIRLNDITNLSVALSLTRSIEQYTDLLKKVKAMTDTVVNGQTALVKSLTALNTKCEDLHTAAVDVQQKIKDNELRSPFANKWLRRAGIDTSPQAIDINGEVDTTRTDMTTNQWGFLFSLALTGTGVRNVAIWLQQCDTRTNALVDLWHTWYANQGGSVLDSIWSSVITLGSSLFSPSASIFITTFYVMHSVKTLINVPLLPINTVRYAFSWADWLTQKCTRRVQQTFRAWTWDDVFGRRDADEIVNNSVGNDAGGGGTANDPLSDFLKTDDDRYISTTVKRFFGFKLTVAEQVTLWQAGVKESTISSVQYGRLVAGLRDELLARQLAGLSELPNVGELRPQGGDRRDTAFNASRYTASILAGKRKGDLWDWARQTTDDLYTLTGRYALVHQASQMWTLVRTLSSIVTSIVCTTTYGGVVLAVLAVPLALAVKTDALRVSRSLVNNLWRGTGVQAIIPMCWTMIRVIQMNQRAITVTLAVTLQLLTLWDNATWLLQTGGNVLDMAYAITTGTFAWSNPITLYESVMVNATALFERNKEVNDIVAKGIEKASISNTFVQNLVNVATVISPTTNTTRLVTNSNQLYDILIQYKQRADDLYNGAPLM
jgi:hypothetical protein